MPQNSRHPFYDRYASKWQKAEDAYAGEDEVKAQGTAYLPKPSGMSTDMYNAYRLRADWFGATDRALDGLSGLVLRRDPQITTEDTELLAQIQAQKNAVISAIKQRLLTGQCGIYVDLAGDNLPVNQLQATWRLYPALSILNWQHSMAGQLIRVVLVETAQVQDDTDLYVTKNETRYRELVLTDQGFVSILWRLVRNNFEMVEEPRQLLRLGQPLSFIPFAFLQFGDKPPLQGLVNKNYDYYRVSADYQHDLHYTSMQTPIFAGWSRDSFPNNEVSLGPDPLVTANTEAKAFMLSPSPAGIESKRLKLDDCLAQMALLGSRILEPSRRTVEATETVQIRQSGEQTALGLLMSEVDTICTQALRWHAWLIGKAQVPDDTTLIYQTNKDYFVSGLQSADIQALVQAWQSGALTQEGLHHNFAQGEILPIEELSFATYQERLAIQGEARGVI